MAYQFVREPLLPDEADRLCNACSDPIEKLVVWILLDTGLRVSELCDLSKDNILWQQRMLRITGKGGIYGKATKKRVVPMSKRVQILLDHWFALKRVANKAHISKEVTPHVLRHTFATLALQKGISLAAVQKILGHDRLSTTTIYLNFTDTHIVDEFTAKW